MLFVCLCCLSCQVMIEWLFTIVSSSTAFVPSCILFVCSSCPNWFCYCFSIMDPGILCHGVISKSTVMPIRSTMCVIKSCMMHTQHNQIHYLHAWTHTHKREREREMRQQQRETDRQTDTQTKGHTNQTQQQKRSVGVLGWHSANRRVVHDITSIVSDQ